MTARCGSPTSTVRGVTSITTATRRPRWAFERLGPERFGDTTVTPVSVPAFWAADLPRSFIRCLQDQSMPRSLADTVTRRLGVQQLTIDTSHSPFLSRPRELAELLVHATTTKPTGSLVPD